MTKPNTTDELREKLAAIEHERWSDWQNYVHKVYLEGNFKEFMLRWQRQIATPYSELSEAEKNSDREQVDRYWHLIETHTQQAVQEAYKKGYIDGHISELTKAAPIIKRGKLKESKNEKAGI